MPIRALTAKAQVCFFIFEIGPLLCTDGSQYALQELLFNVPRLFVNVNLQNCCFRPENG